MWQRSSMSMNLLRVFLQWWNAGLCVCSCSKHLVILSSVFSNYPQCKVGKTHCEKRIQFLGGSEYKSYSSDASTETEPKVHQRLWTLEEILTDETGQVLFKEFLNKEGKDDLLKWVLSFWLQWLIWFPEREKFSVMWIWIF